MLVIAADAAAVSKNLLAGHVQLGSVAILAAKQVFEAWEEFIRLCAQVQEQ